MTLTAPASHRRSILDELLKAMEVAAGITEGSNGERVAEFSLEVRRRSLLSFGRAKPRRYQVKITERFTPAGSYLVLEIDGREVTHTVNMEVVRSQLSTL